jgi:hypothetical protein
MANITLLDIQKLNGNDESIGLIKESIAFAPEIGIIPMDTIRGTTYKTGIRTGLPTCGFRTANDGFDPSKSTFKDAIIQAYIFGGNVEADKAVADAYERGAEAWQVEQALDFAEAAMRELGRQVFYGVANDEKGFPGLKAATIFGTETSDGRPLTIDAGGTTASTASSVYAIKTGRQDVRLIGGLNRAFELSDWRVESVTKDNGTKMTAYVADMLAWIGMQIGHENCVRRIANLTEDSGKGLTDQRLSKLVSSFPIGHRQGLTIFASSRSVDQLEASRTVVINNNGTVRSNVEKLVDRPTSFRGIPIIETDSILDTDAIESV